MMYIIYKFICWFESVVIQRVCCIYVLGSPRCEVTLRSMVSLDGN